MLHAAWMAAGGLAAAAAAHMNMVSPMPLQYKSNPYAQHIDYDIKSPLTPGEYPCHGALDEFAGRGGTPVEAWTPGEAHTVRLEGAATHNGGSCQLSLSYDAGQTFTVLYSKVGGCPLDLDLPFTLPADAPPADRALLAWSWNNHSGNREFYMNCASIQILAAGSKKDDGDEDYRHSSSNSSSGSSSSGSGSNQKTKKREKGGKKKPESSGSGSMRRQQQQKQGTSSSSSYANAALPRIPMHRQDDNVPFASRPRMLVANLFNTTGSACVAEGHDILYPQPGPDYDDVSTAAALPFDCATGQVIPFGAPAPPVPSSVVPLVPSGTSTAGSSSSSSSMGDTGSVSTSSSSIPYESETSSVSSISSATSVTTATSTTSGAAPASATTSTGAGVRTGPCTNEGVYNCIDGTSFQRCASGQWSAAEPVAPGTRCTPGIGNGNGLTVRRRRWWREE